jgi:hypothetical protein
MPPIAPNPQNSRAGLITSLVIFVILFVTSTIMAIHFYTQWEAAELKKTTDVANLAPGVTAAVIANNREVGNVITESKTHPPLTGIEMALQERDVLAGMITGNPQAVTDPAKGVAAVQADRTRALEDVRGDLKKANVSVVMNDTNLLGDLKSLSEQIATLSQSLAQSQSETKAANDKTMAAIKERDTALAQKDKEIADASAKATAAEAAGKDREGAIAKNIADIKAGADAAVAAAQAATTATQAELGKVQQELKKALASQEHTVAVINKYRLNPSRSLLQPAGVITRVPGNNTVFINLGKGQQISPGLTFEVYDHKKGLPSLTTLNPENPDELPNGKASIEVIRILEGTSECRIIHVAPGQQIVEGDLILNLIYNTHTRFAFVVYGEFDLANTGQPNAADADVLRRLVTQWGGRVMDQVNVDTDFLVLGKEPTVLPLPDNPTPLDQERHDKQQKALDNYLARQGEAIHLNIPILNQNRFLYFVGYYDQAKR